MKNLIKLFPLLIIGLFTSCIDSSKESVNDPEYVKSKLSEALDLCYRVNDDYSTVSKVMNEPNFEQLCAFAGWTPDKGAAMTIRANGTHNLSSCMETSIESAYVEAEKSNAKKVSKIISDVKEAIARIRDNSNLALHASSESEYNKYMDWALSANTDAIKKINKAIDMIQ